MIRVYLALGLAAVVAFGLFWGGKALWQAGYDACGVERAAVVLQAQRDAARAGELLSRKEAERLVAEAAAADTALQLEDLANADAIVVSQCLSIDRVRRLNQR
jgi:hypothetical protein